MSNTPKKTKMTEFKEEYKDWKNENFDNNVGFFTVWNDFKEFLPVKSGLSGGAIRLYLFLGIVSKNETGESWYSLKRMKEELECSERTIQDWLSELKKAGLIERLQLKFNGASITFLRPYPLKKQESKQSEIEED